MSEKILILSNSPKGNRLAQYLRERGEEIMLTGDAVTLEYIENMAPYYTISHGYKHIVKAEVADWLKGRIINTHPALLPVNRGSYANFWSFIYNTEKGVTIHRLNDKIDCGEILLQQRIDFHAEEETFLSTYQKLEDAIFNLLTENWEALKQGRLPSYVQDESMATYHSLKKFRELKERINFEWTDNIAEFLKINEGAINQFKETYVD